MQSQTKIIVIALLAVWMNSLYADTRNTTDSYTIQRLLISNDKDEILLVRHENGWMTPALRHQSNMTIQEGLNDLAASFGGRISTPKFAGMFMFLPEYKKGASFRQYFRAHWVGGDLSTPAGLIEAQWFSHEAAEQHMALPAKIVGAEKEMTVWLLKHPKTIWGGSFVLSRDDAGISYQLNEPFFPL